MRDNQEDVAQLLFVSLKPCFPVAGFTFFFNFVVVVVLENESS